jgi:hypothetical protein
MVHPT